jgi:hypothetical protein
VNEILELVEFPFLPDTVLFGRFEFDEKFELVALGLLL